MRRTRITVAAVTATALIGSLSAIPPANAASNANSSITQAAAFSPRTTTKISEDCRKAIINDLELRGAIAGTLVKAGLSAADAAALAPASPPKWQQRVPSPSITTDWKSSSLPS
ncbi:hypothetical protein JCM18909A_14500 [Cutibacterium acnes subsp. elongatum]